MSTIRSKTRTAVDRDPFRSMLVAFVIAGLATIGVTAFASPAAAEEPAAVAVESAAPAEEPAPEVTDEGDTEAGETDSGDVAADPAADETTQPAPADDAAADPPAEDSAAPAEEGDAPPGDAPPATVEEPAAAELAVALLVPPGDEVVETVDICDATADDTSPYIPDEPVADGDVSGHATHVGPIWFPGIKVTWGDIIPPFFYDDGEGTGFFPGLNWDAEGQLIYANDCDPVEHDIDITVTGCVTYSSLGLLEVSLSRLDSDLDYRFTISDPGGVLDSVTIPGTAEDNILVVSLPPGDYIAMVEWSIDAGPRVLLQSQSFTISCPELDLTVMPGACVIGDEGTATVTLTGLIVGESYSWEVTGEGYAASGTFEATADSESVMLEDLPLGNFTAYIEWEEASFVFDWVGVVIEPCQPDVTVTVTQCPASGDTGSAVLTLSSLVEGVEYQVAVTDPGNAGGTPYGGVHTVAGDENGTARVNVSSLPGGQEYTAWIDGLWETEPWEEPPYIGSGQFTPLESLMLSASVGFSLNPCPPATVTPAALATTGSDGVGGMLTGSMLLLGLGSAVLLAARRREGSS